jgi:hypothetical protein
VIVVILRQRQRDVSVHCRYRDTSWMNCKELLGLDNNCTEGVNSFGYQKGANSIGTQLISLPHHPNKVIHTIFIPAKQFFLMHP